MKVAIPVILSERSESKNPPRTRSLPKNKKVYLLGAIRRGAQWIRKDAMAAEVPRRHFIDSSHLAGIGISSRI